MTLPRREGAFWILAALTIPRAIGPVATIALRRLLGPAPVGVFELAMTPYRFLDSIRNFGAGPVLVVERDLGRRDADTAWTVNLLLAIVLAGVAQVVAHPVAVYYGHPAVEGVLRVLAAGYVLSAAGSTHLFLLLRHRDFRTRSIPAVGQVIVAACVAVILAEWGAGVGALATRELVSAAAGTVLLYTLVPYGPRLRLSPSIAWRQFRYSTWIGAALTTLFVSQNIDVFVGGHLIHRAADMGFYSTAWRMAFIVAGLFSGVASGMVFPTLARLPRGPRLEAALLTALRQAALVVLPASGLLASAAPVVIVPLLGGRWGAYRASFAVLSLLTVYAGSRTLLALPFEAYKAIGKPWIVAAYNGARVLLTVPAMIVGAHFGIVGLALAYLPVHLLEIPSALTLARAVLEVPVGRMLGAIRLPLAATAVMSGAVVGTERVCLGAMHIHDVATLAACVLVATAVYAAVMLSFGRGFLREAQVVFFRGL